MKKAALHNLGCKVNAYEMEAMQQMLEKAGYKIVPFAPGADVYVINTCTVTNIADRKSRQMLHRAKKMNENAVVVAVGCYAQVRGEELSVDPDVDIVIGSSRKSDLVKEIRLWENAHDNAAGAAVKHQATPDQVPVQMTQDSAQAETASRRQDSAQAETVSRGQDDALTDIGSWKQDTAYEKLEIDRTEEHTRAFIKVQDGCNQFCSYCIIPYARGRIRSRDPEDVVEEITRLAATGVKEVVITGIHLCSYGADLNAGLNGDHGSRKDHDSSIDGDCGNRAEYADSQMNRDRFSTGENNGNSGCDDREDSSQHYNKAVTSGYPARNSMALLRLLQKVHEIDGIERIRLGSLEPGYMSEAFIQGLAELPKVCPHFHLSLQSGCAKTLRAMNRKYTPEDFSETAALFRKYYEHPALCTDIITGFPGETDEDFEECRAFVESIHFFETHIFPYSRRAGTRAAAMPDQNTEAVRRKRGEVLRQLDQERRKEFLRWYLGKPVEVLFEEQTEVNGRLYWTGHGREYQKVLLMDSRDLSNQIVTVTAAQIVGDDYILGY